MGAVDRGRAHRGLPGDRRWLEQRGPGFYCVQDVPRPLQATLGKRRLIKSLETRDLRTAQARRHTVLAEFAQILAEARQSAGGEGLVARGLEWRDTLSRLKRGDTSKFRAAADGATDEHGRELSDAEHALTVAGDVLDDELEAIAVQHGPEAASQVAAIAHGRATPLLHYVDAWLAEGGAKGRLADRTRGQYRADVESLADWAVKSSVALVIEAFTRRVVGRYVSEAMVATGAHRKTANRKISAASAYWRWLVKRGHIETNPWTGQSLPKERRQPGADNTKRPFTDPEVSSLMAGDADLELHDAMRIAALSGVRIEEIYQLTVGACAGGVFNIQRAKTAAGERRVPIHSDLVEIIARRTEGKPATAFLFHEAGAAKPGRERSMPASKRFGHYRQRVGVHDRAEGQRQSRVDFHSFRRWFVTKARAGFDRAVVAAVVGHEVGNLTDDVYSGGPAMETRRACVESVKLPSAP